MITINREHWLQQAVVPLSRMLKLQAKVTLPPCSVSCGFTGSRKGMRAIGVCWHPSSTKDGVSQVYISPLMDDALRVLDILLHELIHVALPTDGHGKLFGRAARAVGLTGKLTATEAGPRLKTALQKIVAQLGAYPHSAIKTQPRSKSIGKGAPTIVVDPTTGGSVVAGANKLLRLVDGRKHHEGAVTDYSLWVEARFLAQGFPTYQGRVMILARQ